jgi:hypothetical protein
MRRFYKQSLWIPQNFLLTNPDLHHGLLAEALVDHTPASAESLDPKERTRFAAEIAALI